MHQQRKLPSKRYSSYVPPTEFSMLEDQVSSITDDSNGDHMAPASTPNLRTVSTGDKEKVLRRGSLNTLHFDALQNAVSALARIDDFHLETLGYGFFSDVFKVTHKLTGKVMVLKRNKSTNTKLNILREVQLMNRLSHPNILKFMGVCVHQGQLHGLTEFINGGDLDQLVQKKCVALSWLARIRISLDISHGVSYLHSMGIFHRDLTAKNCLIRLTTDSNGKKKYTAVVADLGLAEKIPTNPQEVAKMKVVGTPYCMAPEVLCEKPYNQQSDIFSFGIIICQLIVRTSSDPEKLPRSHTFGLARDLFCSMVTQGVGVPEGPNGQTLMPPSSFLQLGFDCCEVDPSKRPTIQRITQRLDQIVTEEKKNRLEKKRLAKLNNQTPAKRHSSVLAELPSLTGRIEPSMPPMDLPPICRTGSDKENGHPVEQCNNIKKIVPFSEQSSTSTRGQQSSGSCGSPRLSRSYSDISSELISHAASMIASSRDRISGMQESDMSSVVSSLNDAFINPFSAIDKLETERKIFDLPSNEVLEMTFDLPAPRLPHGSPSRSRRMQIRNKHRSRSARPSSLLLEAEKLLSGQGTPVTPPPFLTPPPYPLAVSDFRPLSCPQSPLLSPVSPEPPLAHMPELPFHTRLKNAMIRSMALSPQGCRLLSWWHCRGRSAKSISSVFSVMSEKLGRIQRSISLPNLTQDTTSLAMLSDEMFTASKHTPTSSGSPSPTSSTNQKLPSGIKVHAHPPYATLPRKKKSRCLHLHADVPYKCRSRTSDDVFQDPAFLEILHEEGGDMKAGTTTQGGHQNPAGTRLSNTGEDLLVSNTIAIDSTEVNNNTLVNYINHKKTDAANEQVCGKSTSENKNSHIFDTNVGGGSTLVGGGSFTSMSKQDSIHDIHVPSSEFLAGHTDGNVSSSSSSSGTSSTGLRMTIQTGMVCSNRRRRIGVLLPEPRISLPPISSCSVLKSHPSHPGSPPLSSSSQDLLSEWRNEEEHKVRDSDSSTTQKSNRDSGYNEDVILSDHSTSQFSYTHKRDDICRPMTAPAHSYVPPPAPTHKKQSHIQLPLDHSLSDLTLVSTSPDYPSEVIGSHFVVRDCKGKVPAPPLAVELM